MAVKVEIDTAGRDGDGREEAQSKCVLVVDAIIEVRLKDIKINGSISGMILRIRLENNVFAEFVVPRLVDDESAKQKVDISDATGISRSIIDTVGGSRRPVEQDRRGNSDE